MKSLMALIGRIWVLENSIDELEWIGTLLLNIDRYDTKPKEKKDSIKFFYSSSVDFINITCQALLQLISAYTSRAYTSH